MASELQGGPPIGGIVGWGDENRRQIQGVGGAQDREGYSGQFTSGTVTATFRTFSAASDEALTPPGQEPDLIASPSPGLIDLRGNFADSNAYVAPSFALSEAAAFPGGGRFGVFTTIRAEIPGANIDEFRFFYVERSASVRPNAVRFRAPPREITHEVLAGNAKGDIGSVLTIDTTLVTPLPLQIRYYQPIYVVCYIPSGGLPNGTRITFQTAVH